MNKDLQIKEIKTFDQLEVQEVDVHSDGTSFISIGDFDYISVIDFECNFNSTIILIKNSGYEFNDKTEIEFLNIHFKSSFTFNKSRVIENPIKFVLCKFSTNLSISDKIFENQLLFRNCELQSFNTQNVEFNNLLELYNCTIYKRCVFFTTSFDENVELLNSTFIVIFFLPILYFINRLFSIGQNLNKTTISLAV